MTNAGHREILGLIKENAGIGTTHTFSDTYLGTTHPRFAINAPTMRLIAREWMKDNKALSATQLTSTITSLVAGKSATEKIIGGMLLDYATTAQRKFHPKIFDQWLNELEGWAEVDSICTGKFAKHHVIEQWVAWETLLDKFSKSKNIHKRRASLALLCSPIRYCPTQEMLNAGFRNIDRLKSEKDILITKAISWLLRSMIKLHREAVEDYVHENESSLPAIAIRETKKVLITGKKTG